MALSEVAPTERTAVEVIQISKSTRIIGAIDGDQAGRHLLTPSRSHLIVRQLQGDGFLWLGYLRSLGQEATVRIVLVALHHPSFGLLLVVSGVDHVVYLLRHNLQLLIEASLGE